jgi:hypothetical protein
MLIVDSLAVLHRWSFVESRLFEVVGSWATSTPEPDVARWFASVAHHHAWRSSLWSALVPVLHDVPVPAAPGAWVALLDAVAVPTSTSLRLTGYEVVTAALEERYTSVPLDEVADGPVTRALSLALPDAKEDRRSALSLLAVAPGDEQVAHHRSSLSALLEGLG